MSKNKALLTMNKIAMDGNIRKDDGSLVNGTNDREAYPKRWVAVLQRRRYILTCWVMQSPMFLS